MSSCIMAPIHSGRGHFDYGLRYVKSYNEYFADNNVFLVFSNNEEKENYKKISQNLKYRSIVCTEQLYCTKPISQKKIFGVNYIFNNTEFDKVGVTDVDVVFIKSLNYDELFQKSVDKKVIYVSKSSNKGIIEKVGREAAKIFFSPQDYKKLEEITENFSLYFWFNDIPIYEKKYFKEFLSYINYDKKVKELLYTTFDYILYIWYLLLKDLVKFDHIEVNNIRAQIQDKGSFLEAQQYIDENFFKEAFMKYKPMWIVNQIEDNLMPNVFMKLHVDRK